MKDGCHEPASLPITEESERKPESAYSLSKLVGEVLADQYVRWDPELKIISLRFSNVMTPVDYADFEGWQDDAFKRSCELSTTLSSSLTLIFSPNEKNTIAGGRR